MKFLLFYIPLFKKYISFIVEFLKFNLLRNRNLPFRELFGNIARQKNKKLFARENSSPKIMTLHTIVNELDNPPIATTFLK